MGLYLQRRGSSLSRSFRVLGRNVISRLLPPPLHPHQAYLRQTLPRPLPRALLRHRHQRLQHNQHLRLQRLQPNLHLRLKHHALLQHHRYPQPPLRHLIQAHNRPLLRAPQRSRCRRHPSLPPHPHLLRRALRPSRCLIWCPCRP